MVQATESFIDNGLETQEALPGRPVQPTFCCPVPPVLSTGAEPPGLVGTSPCCLCPFTQLPRWPQTASCALVCSSAQGKCAPHPPGPRDQGSEAGAHVKHGCVLINCNRCCQAREWASRTEGGLRHRQPQTQTQGREVEALGGRRWDRCVQGGRWLGRYRRRWKSVFCGALERVGSPRHCAEPQGPLQQPRCPANWADVSSLPSQSMLPHACALHGRCGVMCALRVPPSVPLTSHMTFNSPCSSQGDASYLSSSPTRHVNLTAK